jgi:hypothetical protein
MQKQCVKVLLHCTVTVHYYTLAEKGTEFVYTFCFPRLLIMLTAVEIMSQNTTVIASCESKRKKDVKQVLFSFTRWNEVVTCKWRDVNSTWWRVGIQPTLIYSLDNKHLFAL